MLWALKYLPKNHVSLLVGHLMHWPLPAPLRAWSLRWFVNTFHIRLEEAEKPVENYATMGDLFVRRLRPGIRPLASAKALHPADSVLSQLGPITQGQMLQVKNQPYLIQDILQDSTKAQSYEGGIFATYYLCPTDYHRVHSPVSGQITSVVHIPGTLWPVFKKSVEKIKNLFGINERVVVYIQTDLGEVAVVFVGALNVGKIELAFDPEIHSQTGKTGVRKKDYQPPLPIQAGEELGLFRMGSTVVLFYPNSYNRIISLSQWESRKGQPVLYGQAFSKDSSAIQRG
jgi:phosphatidylserine decarboxylase